MISDISSSGYIVDDQVTFALDCASTEIYEEGVYNFNGESLSSSELIKFLESLSNKFPLTSIEDPLDENDGMVGLISQTILEINLNCR